MNDDLLPPRGFAEGGLAYLSGRFLPKMRSKGGVPFGGEFGKAPKQSAPQLVAVFIRVIAIFFSYSTILAYGLPPFVYAFYVHAAAGICFLCSGRGLTWSTSMRKHMLLLGVHAGWQVISFVVWLTALLMLHPMQAVLAEYCEHLFLALLTEHFHRSSGSHAVRRRGVIFKFCASLAFLAIAHGWYEIPDSQPAPQKFHPQSNTWGGLALMVVYTLSEVLRKSFKTYLGRNVGSGNVTVVSCALSAPMLFPFVALYSGFAPHAWSVVQSPWHIAVLSASSLLLIVLPSVMIPHTQAGGDLNSPLSASGNTPTQLYHGHQTSARVQCAFAVGCAFLAHFFITYNPGSYPLGAAYLFFFTASFACMAVALTSSHSMITRGSQPYIVDPFADYDLPEIEDLEAGIFATIMKNKTSKKLMVFLLLNVFYMAIEFLYGAFSGSLGLVSDSFHMLLDSVSVGIALIASYIATRPPNSDHTYGYGRYEVLSGFTNGIILICIALYIFMESVVRMVHPQPIEGEWLLSVSVGGLAINVIGVVFFHEAHHVGGGGGGCSHSHGGAPAAPAPEVAGGGCGGHSHGASPHSHDPAPPHSHGGHSHSNGHSHSAHSHSVAPPTGHAHSHGGATGANLRGVYLHILADLLGSVSVIVSSCIVQWTGWVIVDPICSIVISFLILSSAGPLLSDTGAVLLQSLTPDQDRTLQACVNAAHSTPGVAKVTTSLWQHTPGSVVGFVYATADPGMDEISLLASLRHTFTSLAKPSNIAIEVRKPVA